MRHSLAALFLVASTLPASATAEVPATPATQGAQIYRVRQSVVLSDIPEGSARVRWWISIPEDDRAQEILDMSVVSAPGAWSLPREAEHGNRFLYVEVERPSTRALEAVVEFTLRRRPIRVDVDPAKVGVLTAEQRRLFVDELRADAPHMQVTDETRALADRVCGEERNLAVEALKLLEYVAAYADHYSKDPSKPKCGVGDAGDCMTNKGGCCTDLHSLFIALARSRGIPTRLEMGYRLLAKNAGKEVDPGYRCWPEYFVPGYGWVPADIVEADAADGAERGLWLTGLSERRLWLNEGRDFVLTPRQDGPRVNTMVVGYAEIDGRPVRLLPEGDLAPQLARKVRFEEIPDHGAAAIHAAATR